MMKLKQLAVCLTLFAATGLATAQDFELPDHDTRH